MKEIFGDYRKYGLLFLDKQLELLKSNSIIKFGLDYIGHLKIDKENLRREITDELNKGEFSLSNLKHPIYIDLKEKMQSVICQNKEDRQKIPKTAYELLELYWTI